MKKKIAVVNGPNLNLLGKREPAIYGSATLEDLEKELHLFVKELPFELLFYQSNSEGSLIDFIHSVGFEVAGIIFNPGAYTHYSLALRDAVSSVPAKVIEVHISNVYAREEFRRQSVLAPVCLGQISGFGFLGYRLALNVFLEQLSM